MMRFSLWAGATCAAIALLAMPAWAQQRDFNIASQDAISALPEFGRQAGLQIILPSDRLRGVVTPALKGQFDTRAALQKLIANTGLEVASDDNGIVVLRMKPGRGAAVLPPPTRAVAARAEPAPEELTVTGSRIRGGAPIGSELIRIDRVDIERAGFATTADVIRSLPQNDALGPTQLGTALYGTAGNQQNAGLNYGRGSAVNLRGLGSNATLVLVNGRRVAPQGGGTFFDISAIPINAIERMEIVADGASAIYGSDAIAGVVNVILRKDFEGAETSLRYNTMAGGGQSRQASQLAGVSWGTGSAFLSYQYNHRNSLDAAERAYARQDVRPFGGGNYTVNYSNPGNISAGGQSYAIPPGQNGVGLTAASLVPGTTNYQEFLLTGSEILPAETSHTAYLHIDQNIGDRLKLFGDVNFNNRHGRSDGFAAFSALTVPRSNPFFVSPVPGAASVTVLYNFYYDLGPQRSTSNDANYAVTFGGTYSLPNDWQAEAGMLFSKDSIGYNSVGLSTPAINRALADPNPATALNVFGAGSNTNPATLQKLLGFTALDLSYLYRGGQVKADGPLFPLPAGSVRAAVGAEAREEISHSVSRGSTSTDLIVQRPSIDLSRVVVASFAELAIPVFGEANAFPGMRRLDISLAVRSEHYDGFGYTTNPKAGVSWSPIDSLTLHGSYGHSFKAPLLADVDEGNRSVSILPYTDPKSPTGSTSALTVQGGRAGLKPERAKIWSVGADIRPAEIRGLAFDVTYYKIDYTDRVGTIAPTTALLLEAENGAAVQRNPTLAQINALLADPTFGGATAPASSIGAIVDLRRSNLAKQITQGLDLHASYSTPALGGTLTLDSSAAILFKNLTSVTSQSPLGSTLNTAYNPTRYRIRNSVSFERDGMTSSLFMNYVNSYENKTVIPVQRVDSWTTLDLSLGYEFRAPRFAGWLQGTKVSLSVFNLADLDPPFVNASGGYDPVNATPYGRQIALYLSKRW